MSQKLKRTLIILAGIFVGQMVLYGPSLVGLKILLPLNLLSVEGAYSPTTSETAEPEPKDKFLVDLVVLFEPSRRFAVSEIQSGRFPSWAPYHYTGAPFMGPRFSPFMLLQYAVASPVILAWAQMLQAMVAGMGAYLFFRLALRVGFWPAAICAWCYPITAFFVLWQGFATSGGVYWLPWVFLAVDATVRTRSLLAPLGMALATALTLVSGHMDVGAQVLLGSGLFGLWRMGERWGRKERGIYAASPGDFATGPENKRTQPSISQVKRHKCRAPILRLAAAWLSGIMLATPAILPVMEYTQTSARMAYRAAGKEERPPVGLSTLPELALPDMYGSTRTDSFFMFPEGQMSLIESVSAGYAGVIPLLVLAPLAWCSKRHFGLNWFWSGLALFGVSWCLGVPGIVTLLRLPGLKLLSHNRLVFLTCFAVLALAATGLDALGRNKVKWHKGFWLPFALLVALFGWCVFRSLVLPEPLDTQVSLLVAQGTPVRELRTMDDVSRAQGWFVRHYLRSAFWCGVGIVGWLWLFKRLSRRRPSGSGGPALAIGVLSLPYDRSSVAFVGVGIVLMADLLTFGWGRSVQSDPKFYYPRVPVLEAVAKDSHARMIGFQCLPPTLSAICGLRDVRGYDSIDPSTIMDLLGLGCQEGGLRTDYAAAQWLAPKARITPGGDIHLSPVLDMLGVRYVIFRGEPRAGARPKFQDVDYWVMENAAALPRVFVPKRVEVEADKTERLRKLGADDFRPGEVAYVESPLALPQACAGRGEIMQETPARVVVSYQMETAGLLVISDLWDKGWRAYLNGNPVPILRADHALRGVVVPQGQGRVEFRYTPAGFRLGCVLASAAVLVIAGCLGFQYIRGRAAKKNTDER